MLLRLWLLLASARFKPRLALLDECVTRLRVWPNDLDINLHLTNNRYLRAMDLGRYDFGQRAGVWGKALRYRMLPLLGSATLSFRKGLDPFQRYELRTRIVAWDEKWFWFEQRFCVGDKVHALGRVKVLFRGPDGNVPTAELFARWGDTGASQRNMPEPVRLALEAEHADRR